MWPDDNSPKRSSFNSTFFNAINSLVRSFRYLAETPRCEMPLAKIERTLVQSAETCINANWVTFEHPSILVGNFLPRFNLKSGCWPASLNFNYPLFYSFIAKKQSRFLSSLGEQWKKWLWYFQGEPEAGEKLTCAKWTEFDEEELWEMAHLDNEVKIERRNCWS